MLNAACRRQFDIVIAPSIDRLGRSLIDLLNSVQTLEACGVDLYLDQQNIDTTTPTGRLMFQITGAFAEFERSMIRQRVKLGLKRGQGSRQATGVEQETYCVDKNVPLLACIVAVRINARPPPAQLPDRRTPSDARRRRLPSSA